MTKEQAKHVESLVRAWTEMARVKYAKGAEEHGGDLWDKTTLELLDEAISENIDQFVYLMTARQKLVAAPATVESPITTHAEDCQCSCELNPTEQWADEAYALYPTKKEAKEIAKKLNASMK